MTLNDSAVEGLIVDIDDEYFPKKYRPSMLVLDLRNRHISDISSEEWISSASSRVYRH